MRLIDADALIEKWYEINDIGPEDRGARFVGYTEIPRFINNAPTVETTGDYISREEAREAVKHSKSYVIFNEALVVDKEEVITQLSALPSAEAVPQSEQYKKGFEDAKRAFLVEYARESENMRKRNAELEVMLNAQKAISAESRSVVRCEDCCHRVHDEERGLYYCEMYYGQGDVSDENFCQWGERREPSK